MAGRIVWAIEDPGGQVATVMASPAASTTCGRSSRAPGRARGGGGPSAGGASGSPGGADSPGDHPGGTVVTPGLSGRWTSLATSLLPPGFRGASRPSPAAGETSCCSTMAARRSVRSAAVRRASARRPARAARSSRTGPSGHPPQVEGDCRQPTLQAGPEQVGGDQLVAGRPGQGPVGQLGGQADTVGGQLGGGQGHLGGVGPGRLGRPGRPRVALGRRGRWPPSARRPRRRSAPARPGWPAAGRPRRPAGRGARPPARPCRRRSGPSWPAGRSRARPRPPRRCPTGGHGRGGIGVQPAMLASSRCTGLIDAPWRWSGPGAADLRAAGRE